MNFNVYRSLWDVVEKRWETLGDPIFNCLASSLEEARQKFCNKEGLTSFDDDSYIVVRED